MRAFGLSCLVFALTSAFPAEVRKCAVCGMEFSQGSKTSYEATIEGKALPLCSFQCAVRTHRKYPTAKLEAFDFMTGKRVPVETAFFLAKSKNLLSEVEFGMAPTIVAFADKKSAESTNSRLGDGTVVQGFSRLEKLYE